MLHKLAAILDTGFRPWLDPVAGPETAEYRDGQAEGASDSLADTLAQISAPSDEQIGDALRLGLPILVLLGALYLFEVWFRESNLLATVAWFCAFDFVMTALAFGATYFRLVQGALARDDDGALSGLDCEPHRDGNRDG
jgi:hypothetical protein